MKDILESKLVKHMLKYHPSSTTAKLAEEVLCLRKEKKKELDFLESVYLTDEEKQISQEPICILPCKDGCQMKTKGICKQSDIPEDPLVIDCPECRGAGCDLYSGADCQECAGRGFVPAGEFSSVD